MSRVDGVGQWLAPLGLRVILAWEFFESGQQKLVGANWFAQLGDRFPWPFSLLGAGINWSLATWIELLGSVALLLGLGTRYVAYALGVLTIVATYAVHWPMHWHTLAELWNGYAITNKGFGNYKLPLLYLVMLLPLMLGGAGRLSMDALLARRLSSLGTRSVPAFDPLAWGGILFAIGLPLSLLLPWAGATLVVAGVVFVLSALGSRAA
jgi:putative oxidoreductase